MDEKVLETAMQRFDASITKFEEKQSARVGELEDRINDIEAEGVTAGAGGTNGRQHKARRALDAYLRLGDTVELKAMSIGVSAASGGALVPEVIARPIIEQAVALSPLAQVVRRTITATSDYVRLVNLRGQGTAWTAEAGTRSEQASLLMREVRPTHGELFTVTGFTRWLEHDSQFDVVDLIERNASVGFSKALEAAIVGGDGSDKPTGLLDTAPVTTDDDASPVRAADALEYISGSADLANDLIDLFFALKPEYRRSAVFVMSSASLAAVRKLRDASGSGFLWQQNMAQGIDAPDGLLLGKRVITTEELGVVGSSPANNAILCGDFNSGYEIVEIGPMSIVRDDVTDRGRVLLYIAQRFGGRIVDNNALKVLKA